MVRIRRLYIFLTTLVLILYLRHKYKTSSDADGARSADLPPIDDAAGTVHCWCGRSLGGATLRIEDAAPTCGAENVQNVLSYSFFGSIRRKYFKGIEKNAELAWKFYPGWTMRVYHDLNQADGQVRSALCALSCGHPHLEFCSVNRLTWGTMSIADFYGTFWRFLVLGDPSVHRFLVRDLDSLLIRREVDAVADWILSNKTWHFMRDAPFHKFVVLAGMWGGVNGNMARNAQLRIELFSRATDHKWSYADQNALASLLYPMATEDMVAHDSYFCNEFRGSRPFPTRRVEDFYVGEKFRWKPGRGTGRLTECPFECRPLEHLDWNFC